MSFIFGGQTGLTYGQLKDLQERVKARRIRSAPSMGDPLATGLTVLGKGVGDAIGSYRLRKQIGERDQRFKEAMQGELGDKIFANRSAYASGAQLPHPDLAREILASDVFQGREDLFGELAPSLFSAPAMRKARASNKEKPALTPLESKFYSDSLQRNGGDLKKVVSEAEILFKGNLSPALMGVIQKDIERVNSNLQKKALQTDEQKARAYSQGRQHTHEMTMANISNELGKDRIKFESELDLNNRFKTERAKAEAGAVISAIEEQIPAFIAAGATPDGIIGHIKSELDKVGKRYEKTEETTQPTQAQGLPVPLEASKELVKQAVNDNPMLSSRIKRTTNPKQIKNILKQTRLRPRDLYYLERNGIDVWNLDNDEIGVKEISHQRGEGFKLFSDENTGELRMSSGFIPEKGFEHKTPNWGARTKEYNAMKRSYGQLTNVNNSIYGRAKTAQRNILNIIKKEGLGLTGAGSLLMEHIPESGSHALNNQLVTIRSLVTTLALNELRSASPTGGALGQVSNYEGTKLEAALGVVNQAQTEEQFKMGLENVMSSMNRLVQMGKISEAIETKDYSKINNETLEYAKNLRDDNGNNVFETAVWKAGNRSVNAIRIASPDSFYPMMKQKPIAHKLGSKSLALLVKSHLLHLKKRSRSQVKFRAFSINSRS